MVAVDPALPEVHDYPERSAPRLTAFDAAALRLLGGLRPVAVLARPLGPRATVLRATRHAERRLERLGALSSAETAAAALIERRQAVRDALRRGQLSSTAIGEAFALLRVVAEADLGLRPFDVQLLAVHSLLRGEIAEMATGEGKSLAAALAAALLALAGSRVHVMTVNDYLAERDRATFAPLFLRLGLDSALLRETTPQAARRTAYRCAVIYGAARTFVFDYLRDREAFPPRRATRLRRRAARLAGEPNLSPVMQGLSAAIVDEADSVLIDEAATPFILSGGQRPLGGIDTTLLRPVLEAARGLQAGRDFWLSARDRRAGLTVSGRRAMERVFAGRADLLAAPPVHRHLAEQALVALHALVPARDYLVHENAVHIIDPNTGRLAEGRQWSRGLHQMVELLNGLEPTSPRETLARITYQRFFPRYVHLCGMTGTARPAAAELWSVYGLSVRRIATRLPSRRRWRPPVVYATGAARWAAVAAHAAVLARRGAPVLIGVRTLADSRVCAAALRDAGVAHVILNAEHADREAAIVAGAGQGGQVTIATSMAGRGTDIRLNDAARAAGGLHVILTALHDDRRIDLQLAGRCARQGDPGEVAWMLSLDDPLAAEGWRGWRVVTALALAAAGDRAAASVMRLRQWLRSRRSAATRARLQADERRRHAGLAIAGPPV